MKISEKLAELKQMEGELMRKYGLRDSIAKQTFKDTMVMDISEMKKKDIEAEQKKFIEAKKGKVNKLTESIEELQKKIIGGRNQVNKKNIKSGLDMKLIEMKFLRLELSKLMGLIKKDDFMSRGLNIDIDVWEELGISDRISLLEKRKSKLDAEIQHSNWSNDL